MAQIELKVTPEVIATKLTELKNYEQQMGTLLQQDFVNKASSLLSEGHWTGEASTAFNTKVTQLCEPLTGLMSVIKEYIDDLTAIEEIYRATESQVQEKAEGLRTTGIFGT